ncbi:MAG TPA: PQQ-binding-like beta-propeller repeat protein, partial [Phycisphaerae bacterium]|nr:PQQ-binding-like beta-propeller repeat protein [Phycisphaerae bacterium]
MRTLCCALLVVSTITGIAFATETEHLGMQVLPAPGKVVIDGKTADWDVSAGILACSDVENMRDKFSVWFHTMWDAGNLYLLARWNDETPLNNPGSSKGDYGFAGDCLQFRTIVPADDQNGRCGHWDAWLDRDGVSVISVQYGRQFNQGGDKNVLEKGARQAFQKNADAKGYAQEIAIPWKLIGGDGYSPKPADKLQLTVEPNFTIGTSGRLSLKDLFKAGVTPDRVFTFMASNQWGIATLEAKGKLKPRPVRLTDGREFPVTLENGTPTVDWTGLIKVKELKGFETISFTMPEDGCVSLVIRNKDGQVVRQLLNAAFMTKGKKQVKWDGLTNTSVTRPGEPVPPGDYTWEAIWDKGIGLRLRGWACNGGSAPWDGATGKENWGGDHGVPCSAASDDKKVYVGWSGAEAGKALLALDLNGNVQWKNSRGGMAGAELVAVDAGTVYVQNWKGNLYRVDSQRGG